MSEAQDKYVLQHLNLFRGMVAEIQSKQRLLLDRLRKYPERVDEIKLQLGGLEGEMDALNVTIDFIEKWPASCPLVASEQCKTCEYMEHCPIATHKCSNIESKPTVVVTSDGQVAANVGVTVLEVDVDEEEVVQDDALPIDELPEKVLDLLDE